MARVLFISVVFEPDTVSTSTMAAGRARQLVALGHDVGVLSSVPHYNVSAETRASQACRARPWRPIIRDVENGMTVVRCYIPPIPDSVALRALHLAMLHTLLLYAALRHFRDREVVLVISPPLTLALVGLVLRWVSKTKVLYNVQELWPDVPRDLGVVKSRSLLKALDLLERQIYRASDVVIPIGPRFAEIISGRSRGAAKVHVIPNFVDTTWIRPSEKKNDLAAEWGLTDKKVVLYAGNIGLTQDFATLIGAAKALQHLDVQFVVVGGGSGRPGLEQALASAALPNVVLEDYVSTERVNDLHALADVIVVPLRRGHDRTTTPSKIFSAMAAGRPLVVTAAADTDLAWTVEDAKAGIVVPVEDVEALTAAITRLIEDPAGCWDPEKALKVARELSPSAVGKAYHQLIERVTHVDGATA